MRQETVKRVRSIEQRENQRTVDKVSEMYEQLQDPDLCPEVKKKIKQKLLEVKSVVNGDGSKSKKPEEA